MKTWKIEMRWKSNWMVENASKAWMWMVLLAPSPVYFELLLPHSNWFHSVHCWSHINWHVHINIKLRFLASSTFVLHHNHQHHPCNLPFNGQIILFITLTTLISFAHPLKQTHNVKITSVIPSLHRWCWYRHCRYRCCCRCCCRDIHWVDN